MRLITLLIGCGILGWYVGVKGKEKRRRRIFIAERDILASFGILKKDVDGLLKKYNGGDTVSEQGAREMKSVLKRIAETIDENQQYVVQNVEEIETRRI